MGHPLRILVTLAILAPASCFAESAIERPPPCPASPNCVSSDAHDERHGIAAFTFARSPDGVWRATRGVVAGPIRAGVLR